MRNVRRRTGSRRGGLDGALKRRDRTVEAYAKLVRLWEADRDACFAELRRFIETENHAADSKKESFASHLERGTQAELEKARARLSHLDGAKEHPVVRKQPQTETAALGMCGQLYTVLQPEVG